MSAGLTSAPPVTLHPAQNSVQQPVEEARNNNPAQPENQKSAQPKENGKYRYFSAIASGFTLAAYAGAGFLYFTSGLTGAALISNPIGIAAIAAATVGIALYLTATTFYLGSNDSALDKTKEVLFQGFKVLASPVYWAGSILLGIARCGQETCENLAK